MGDGLLRVLLYVTVCAAAALVHGATRATEPAGIVRHAAREFLRFAGGVALLCFAIWVLTTVVQS